MKRTTTNKTTAQIKLERAEAQYKAALAMKAPGALEFVDEYMRAASILKNTGRRIH